MKIDEIQNKKREKAQKKRFDENSKQRILTTAMNLFAQKGFESVSVREICNLAEVNLCMVSYHFGGKTELYQAIVDNIAQRQIKFFSDFVDLNKNIEQLSKKDKLNMLYMIIDKAVDFIYKNISSDMLGFMIKAQHLKEINFKTPMFLYVKKLIASIFEIEENDKKAVYQAIFILSQINAPKFFPTFSLLQFKKKNFDNDDIEIIKNNLKIYLDGVFKEVKND